MCGSEQVATKVAPTNTSGTLGTVVGASSAAITGMAFFGAHRVMGHTTQSTGFSRFTRLYSRRETYRRINQLRGIAAPASRHSAKLLKEYFTERKVTVVFRA